MTRSLILPVLATFFLGHHAGAQESYCSEREHYSEVVSGKKANLPLTVYSAKRASLSGCACSGGNDRGRMTLPPTPPEGSFQNFTVTASVKNGGVTKACVLARGTLRKDELYKFADRNIALSSGLRQEVCQAVISTLKERGICH